MAKRSDVPTMKDVARAAGVSVGTVSKVVNHIPVGESCRKRVEAAIEALDYHVNSYARGLKVMRTFTIALIIPNIRHSFYADLADQLNRTMAERGYQLLLITTDRGDEQAFISMLRPEKVDGAVVLSYSKKLNFPASLPVVSIDRRFGPDIPCVTSDNYAGGALAARRLRELGCRRLAVTGAIADKDSEVVHRVTGFTDACRDMDMPCGQDVTFTSDRFDTIAAFLEGHIHDGRFDYDGLFVTSDWQAWESLHLLVRHGIRVPEDVLIIGYDGCRRFGFLDRYCSTIVQPVEAIAATCTSLLLDENDDPAPPCTCLPVWYEAGGTTKS